MAHRARGEWTRPMPLHVTLRMAPHVYNLRSRRSFRVIEAALRIGGDRFGVRVIHFSVQGNHIHLLVEAPNRRALARAIQGFSIRVAKGLNRMMGRSGRVFDDRYHARVLRTPTEVRHAIHYVLFNRPIPSGRSQIGRLAARNRPVNNQITGQSRKLSGHRDDRRLADYLGTNARKHAAERGETYAPGYVDPYSSAGAPDLTLPSARTWLLREGWMRSKCGSCARKTNLALDGRSGCCSCQGQGRPLDEIFGCRSCGGKAGRSVTTPAETQAVAS
jgi:REP element-mobilizing transposase RayT